MAKRVALEWFISLCFLESGFHVYNGFFSFRLAFLLQFFQSLKSEVILGCLITVLSSPDQTISHAHVDRVKEVANARDISIQTWEEKERRGKTGLKLGCPRPITHLSVFEQNWKSFLCFPSSQTQLCFLHCAVDLIAAGILAGQRISNRYTGNKL